MTDEVDELLNKLHELAGTKPLANIMARLLILSDDIASLNGAPMAIAMWQADPSISKENALENLEAFNRSCVEYLEENWASLSESHRKLINGEARRVPFDQLRERVISTIAELSDVERERIEGSTTVSALDIDTASLALFLENEFDIAGLGHSWDVDTTVFNIIYDVDAKVEGYV